MICFSVCMFAVASEKQLSPFERADMFGIGPLGDGGTTSEEERGLRALLKTPDASEKLSQIIRSASPAGQLYALLGLHLRDPQAFDRAIPDFLRRDDIVTTMTGCIINEERMATVAQRIARGEYDHAMQRPPR